MDFSWITPSAGGGKVLQVVSAASSGGFSTTSSTYSDTNLSVSITPSASTSKVLVFVSQQYQMAKSGYAYGGIQLVRNSSTIKDWGNPMLGINVGSSNNAEVISIANFHYLDSPATTSSTTYKTQMRAYDSSTVQANNIVSSIITVLEIGA